MARIESLWYRYSPLHGLLIPASLIFGALAAVRRSLYRLGLLKKVRLPVPVVVVGNISVGGSGKTPLVIWLAHALRERGLNPGIVSRGYGGSATSPEPVFQGSDPSIVGDEPVLMAVRSGCPVWVGSDRVEAAEKLLASHPECNVILSDDGLQHYRLERDVEIVVVDGERRFGNGLLLPAGPLREGTGRLRTVDAVIINTPERSEIPATNHDYEMVLRGETFYNLLNPEFVTGPASFQGRRLHAIAGIGNPKRFFDHLARLGLAGVSHAFPDHHRFEPRDLEFEEADAIVMTEKDAVKCSRFATEKLWALSVKADVDSSLADRVLDKVRSRR